MEETSIFEDIDRGDYGGGKSKAPEAKKSKFKEYVSKQFNKAKTGIKEKYEETKALNRDIKQAKKKAYRKQAIREAVKSGQRKAKLRFSPYTTQNDTGNQLRNDLLSNGNALRNDLLGNSKKGKNNFRYF